MKRIHRPLPPHLTIYKSQLTSTFPISHRISGAILASMVLLSYFLCLKMGLICLTYFHFYQFFFYTFKFIPSSVDLTAFALFFHLYHGVRHLLHKMQNFWMEFEMHIYIIYLQNRFVRIFLNRFLLLFLFLFICLIIIHSLVAIIALCFPVFATGIPPELVLVNIPDIETLATYLDREGQDQEWVTHVWDTLVNETRPNDLPGQIAFFIELERASLTKMKITSLLGELLETAGYQQVPESYIDCMLQEILKQRDFEWNLLQLRAIQNSLRIDGIKSHFFKDILQANESFLQELYFQK